MTVPFVPTPSVLRRDTWLASAGAAMTVVVPPIRSALSGLGPWRKPAARDRDGIMPPMRGNTRRPA
jgi:hypothetical protein